MLAYRLMIALQIYDFVFPATATTEPQPDSSPYPTVGPSSGRSV